MPLERVSAREEIHPQLSQKEMLIVRLHMVLEVSPCFEPDIKAETVLDRSDLEDRASRAYS